MKIKFEGFGNSSHSWGLVQQSIARQMILAGHEVHFRSTNGYEYIPSDILRHIKLIPDPSYDLQLSYTLCQNFPHYLKCGTKNRFAIYNYDTGVDGTIPAHWVKYHQYADLILPSSEYSKQIFLQSKIPESKLKVVPHGIDLKTFNVEPYQINSKKSFKILVVVGQVHFRKNLKGILEAFGKAFTKTDDVVLVLKLAKDTQVSHVDVDWNRLFKEFVKHHPLHAEVEVIWNFIPQIESLYNAADLIMSLSHIECFHLPSLQGIGAGKLVMASGVGGNVDFMNHSNSLLISGKIVRCPPAAQYWNSSKYVGMFEPNIDEAAEKLRGAYKDYDGMMSRMGPAIKETAERFTWKKAADQIMELTK